MMTFDMKDAKFDWRTVKDSLSVRFVLKWGYNGHTFVIAETRLLSESAWQSIDDVARTMRYCLIGTLTGIINRMVENGTI